MYIYLLKNIKKEMENFQVRAVQKFSFFKNKKNILFYSIFLENKYINNKINK